MEFRIIPRPTPVHSREFRTVRIDGQSVQPRSPAAAHAPARPQEHAQNLETRSEFAEPYRSAARMPFFITQGRYTESAIGGMIQAPEDRSKALKELVDAAGGRLISWYLTFGEYVSSRSPNSPTPQQR